MKTYDYLVVGSGCAGAMAAQTLVEAGVNVAMIDVGNQDSTNFPSKDFLSIRQTEDDQYKYFIGKKGEGITWGEISKGAQVTPPRMHMTKQVEKYIPLESSNFSPLESLGYGGLGIGWGLQCWEYSAADLKKTGLDPVKINNAYELVSGRIGVSASRDTAADYTIGKLKTYQPSATADRNHQYIQQKYDKHGQAFRDQGAYVGRTPLALITEDKDGRDGYRYRDMDFYSNDGLSAWRPYVTIDQLIKKTNFEYIKSKLVTNFVDKDGMVTVNFIDTKTNQAGSVKCRKLILASSALGSARIVLRSLGNDSSRTSILSNPHSYIPCLQPAMVGKGIEPKKLGLGQLSYFIDQEGGDNGLSVASSYSYQSLMLFRIVNQAPLNFIDGRIIMNYLMSGLVIIIAQHPDALSADKYLQLTPDKDSPTGDKLIANYELSGVEESKWDRRENQYMKLMRKLGTYPIKRVPTPHGSGIHYAGTLPFSKSQKDFSLNPNGRLHGTKNVYVADSSGFAYLPGKGLTFTLMANAHLTAESALRNK